MFGSEESTFVEDDPVPLEREKRLQAHFEIPPFHRKDVVGCDNDIAGEHILEASKSTGTAI